MTWSSVAGRGGANTKIAGTTLGGSPSAAIAAGDVCFVSVSTDNFPTTSGESSQHSLSDTDTHAWIKLFEYTYSAGVAADGLTTSLFGVKTTAEIATTDTITLTCANSVAAKTMAFWEASITGTGFTRVSYSVGNAVASANGPSLSLSGLDVREYLFLSVDAFEGASTDVYTKDADYTLAASRGSSAGVANTNITHYLHRRIASLSGDTYQGSNGTTTPDWASGLTALLETSSLSFEVGQIPF